MCDEVSRNTATRLVLNNTERLPVVLWIMQAYVLTQACQSLKEQSRYTLG